MKPGRQALSPILGVEYFRPPNPPLECWERDLRHIASLGLNTIRCWLYWRTVEPEETRWDFSAYDRLFKLAGNNGLKVLVTLIGEVPPEWALQRLPDARWVHAEGQPSEILYNSGMVTVGGYPGLCLDEPRARELASRFFHEVARRYGRNKALAGFALQNEVMPFYSMHGAQVNHPCQRVLFKVFLKRKYGNIQRYNEVHMTHYDAFEDVQMRARGLPTDYMDIIEFCAERVVEQLKWRRDIVRSESPQALTFCHAAGGVNSVLCPPWVQEEIAGLVDSWGTSMYDPNYWQHLLSAVVTRSAAAGKPWGVVEMTGGSMWTHYPTTTRTPEELVSLPLTYLSLGATTNLFWQYRPERVGTECPNFGLVLENGRMPRRARAVERLGKALKKHREMLAGLEWPRARISLVVDWHGYAYEVGLGDKQLHSSRTEELAGINGALALGGFEACAISSAYWEKRGNPAGIRLLILPNNVVLSKTMIQHLRNAAEKGISVLAGPMCGHFTAHGWLRTLSEFRELERLFGCARSDFSVAEACTLQANSCAVSGAQFFEEYTLLEAEPWLWSGVGPAAGGICGTRRKIGKAIFWRYGSMLGRAFYSVYAKASGGTVRETAVAQDSPPPASSLPDLLAEVARTAGIKPDHPAQPPFVIRVARSGEKRVAFVRNPLGLEQHFLPWPDCQPVAALDGKDRPPGRGQAVSFAPHQTRVFKLFA